MMNVREDHNSTSRWRSAAQPRPAQKLTDEYCKERGRIPLIEMVSGPIFVSGPFIVLTRLSLQRSVATSDIDRKLMVYPAKPASAVRPMLQSRSLDSWSVIGVA